MSDKEYCNKRCFMNENSICTGPKKVLQIRNAAANSRIDQEDAKDVLSSMQDEAIVNQCSNGLITNILYSS